MNKFPQHPSKTFLSLLRRTSTLSPSILSALAFVAATGISYGDPPLPTGERLRDLGDINGIKIGAAIWNYDWNDPANADFKTVAQRELKFFTSENEMKIGATEEERNVFTYATGQRIVDLAASAGGEVHGHALVWWASNPDWVRNGNWTADTLRDAMYNHIDNVAGHWAGDIAVWDVVNESFKGADKLGPGLTWDQCFHGYQPASQEDANKDKWYNVIGPTYIEKAFTRARAAAPNAVLIYNDWEIEGMNRHSTAVYNMIRDFRGLTGRTTLIPIDGIGAQMHLGISNNRPSSLMRENFDRFGKLGMKIFITEFDCPTTILIPDPDNIGGFKAAADSSPPSLIGLDRQARAYHDALNIGLRSPGFAGFQTWGMRNKSGAAKLIFSLPGLEPLPSYYAIQDALDYQQHDEMVANGRVEDATLSPWSGSSNGTSTIAASTATAHSGTKSILVSGRTSGSAGPGQNVTALLKDIETPGSGSGRYYMRAWMRTASGTADGKLTLRLKDGTGVTKYIGIPKKQISTTWTEVSGWVNVKWFKDLTSAVFYAETPDSTGNFYIDDVTFSDGNLLKNGNFEDGMTTNWGTYVGGSIANVGAETDLETVYKYGRKGGYVTGRSETYHGPAQNITTALLASGPGSYKVSAWVKLKKPNATTTLTTNANIIIRTNDNTGLSYKPTGSFAISTDKWTKVSGTVNVTWSGALSDARLYIQTSGLPTTSFYVDEVIARRDTGGSSSAAATTAPNDAPKGLSSRAS